MLIDRGGVERCSGHGTKAREAAGDIADPRDGVNFGDNSLDAIEVFASVLFPV